MVLAVIGRTIAADVLELSKAGGGIARKGADAVEDRLRGVNGDSGSRCRRAPQLCGAGPACHLSAGDSAQRVLPPVSRGGRQDHRRQHARGRRGHSRRHPEESRQKDESRPTERPALPARPQASAHACVLTQRQYLTTGEFKEDCERLVTNAAIGLRGVYEGCCTLIRNVFPGPCTPCAPGQHTKIRPEAQAAGISFVLQAGAPTYSVRR